jgi:hypothetical protein
MKFLVPSYSCLQNPWLGGCGPRSPFSLSSVLTWICWTPPPKKNSWVRHWCRLTFCLHVLSGWRTVRAERLWIIVLLPSARLSARVVFVTASPLLLLLFALKPILQPQSATFEDYLVVVYHTWETVATCPVSLIFKWPCIVISFV